MGGVIDRCNQVERDKEGLKHSLSPSGLHAQRGEGKGKREISSSVLSISIIGQREEHLYALLLCGGKKGRGGEKRRPSAFSFLRGESRRPHLLRRAEGKKERERRIR